MVRFGKVVIRCGKIMYVKVICGAILCGMVLYSIWCVQ